MQTVAVVIPCLNEADNLKLLLPQIWTVLREMALPAEVYVIDGGSTDDTTAVAQQQGAHVIRQRGTGYGGAIKTAFEDITSTYIITLDADLSHHPAILKYLYEMRERAEIVIASRYVKQGYGAMPWSRKILSGILNRVFRRILDIPVHDLSSGFRLYRRKAVAALNLEFNSYAVLQEILVKAFCQGYQVKEIPFHYLPRRHGKTHARLIRFGIDYLKVLFKMWRLRNSIASADYDSRAFNGFIPLQRYWQRRRYHIILDYLGDALRVLDAGCGSTQILDGAPQIVGMDILIRKLRFMRRPGRKLVQASTFNLPFKDHAFQTVISSEVIEHVAESEALFDELARCVEPGGVLILGTPDYSRWQWPLIEWFYGHLKPSGYAEEHITHYTFDRLKQHLDRLGFVIEDNTYILGGELIIKARKPLDAS
ncbi:MAG TPA: glycosyltransferase [Candidatus Hydrogenedentes bacterium]|nr:glycosyltransferase [Candidatus Hydrogenedentota bacterium]